MARSQEKAMSTLNRWVDQRRVIETGGTEVARGARFPGECKSVKEGEASRSQVIRELTSLIAQIQNATLGEQRIRDLNDQINKLMRSKYAWEIQIRKLGGPDYTSLGAKIGEAEGVELPGQGGYRYFGAAKDLPGVRELFEQEVVVEPTRKTRKDLLRYIQPDYYGWRDEDDMDLLVEESRVEADSQAAINRLRASARAALGAGDSKGLQSGSVDLQEIIATVVGSHDHVDLERFLLQKKKEMLIAKYIDPAVSPRSHGAKARGSIGLKYGTAAEESSEQQPPLSADVELVE